MRRAALQAAASLCLGLAACSSGLRGGTYEEGDVRFHIAAPPAERWSAVSFAGNALAWTARGGHVLAVNATCEDHGDPSLKVLTDHLLMGFEERQLRKQEALSLDGRAALRTVLTARLDGVPRDLELTVMKKDGCVFDFTYTAPGGHFEELVDDYQKLVASFSTGAE